MPPNLSQNQVSYPKTARCDTNVSEMVADSHKGRLLDEVVMISQLKLLRRLRSKHAPRSNYKPYGQPIILQLREAFKYLEKNKKNAKDRHLLEIIVMDLDRSFNALEKLSADEARSNSGAVLLRKIVFDVYSKLEISKLRSLLALIPSRNSPWPGTSLERVVRKYQKLSQYVSAAAHLRHIIRNYQEWKIEVAFGSPYTKQQLGEEPRAITGLFAKSISKSDSRELKGFQSKLPIHLNKSRHEIETNIQRLVMEKKCVRAEIQLVYHYAQYPEGKLRRC